MLEIVETTFSLITDPQQVHQLIVTGFAIARNFGAVDLLSSLYATLGLLLGIPFLNLVEGTYIMLETCAADSR